MREGSAASATSTDRGFTSHSASQAYTGPSAFMAMTAIHATQGFLGSQPNPPKYVAKKEAKPKNMAGTREKILIRPVYMSAELTTRMIKASAVSVARVDFS